MIKKDVLIRDILISTCKIAEMQNISFESLNDDKSKAGLVVELVNATLRLVKDAGYDLAWKTGGYYIYCGSHWMQISLKEVSFLLSSIAKTGKIHTYTADHHRFKNEAINQFKSSVRDLKSQLSKSVKINCANGTLVFDTDGVYLQPYSKNDYFIYILNYNYKPEAQAPLFQKTLNEALPLDGQIILQEYIASVFLPNFNHEYVLFMYGMGANSKSVIQKILSAALGRENITNRSLESLCAEESRTICDLEGRLLNICSEMSPKFNIENFKKIASKEPVTARRLYGEPYTLYTYASLLFSCNELPRNIEFTHGYFRRLLILPFLNIIPEEKQDRTLADRIIATEIEGVLNWIVEGVKRLLVQGKFSKCEIAEKAMEQYKVDADSVASYLADNNYQKSHNNTIALKQLFAEYLKYCKESNCHSCALKTFSSRLKLAGIDVVRRAQGMVVHVKYVPPIMEEPQIITSTIKDLGVEDFFPIQNDELNEKNEITKKAEAVTDTSLSEDVNKVIEDIK